MKLEGCPRTSRFAAFTNSDFHQLDSQLSGPNSQHQLERAAPPDPHQQFCLFSEREFVDRPLSFFHDSAKRKTNVPYRPREGTLEVSRLEVLGNGEENIVTNTIFSGIWTDCETEGKLLSFPHSLWVKDIVHDYQRNVVLVHAARRWNKPRVQVMTGRQRHTGVHIDQFINLSWCKVSTCPSLKGPRWFRRTRSRMHLRRDNQTQASLRQQ